MNCSNCGGKILPVVAIDVDGTLGDFHSHFLKFAEEYFAQTLEWSKLAKRVECDYDGSIPFKVWCKQAFKITDSDWKQVKLAYRQGGSKRTMPAYEWGISLIRYIMSQGAELWLTTSRPAYRLDNIDPDTQEWCRRNKVPFNYALYDDEKYSTLAQRVDPERVIAVMDDLPEMYDAAAEAFGDNVPILVKSIWNRAVQRPRELPVNDFGNSAHLIGWRIMNWKKAHA